MDWNGPLELTEWPHTSRPTQQFSWQKRPAHIDWPNDPVVYMGPIHGANGLVPRVGTKVVTDLNLFKSRVKIQV